MGNNFSILCVGAAEEYPRPDGAISPGDVYALHRMLFSIGLPTELVLYIVELAGYSAPVKTCREDKIRILWTDCPRGSLARLYLLASPVPAFGAWRRVKKVVWVLNSMVSTSDRPNVDAWFEACIFRRTHCEPTSDAQDIADIWRLYFLHKSPAWMAKHLRIARAGWSLVRNGDQYVWLLPPNREHCNQVIEWYPDSSSRGVTAGEAAKAGADGGGFVEALQPGDRVGLWMRVGHKGRWNSVYGAYFEIVYDWDC